MSSQLYRNDNNIFTDVTSLAGIQPYVDNFAGGIQVVMEDFDNDTHVDILLTSLSTNHYLLMNNGDFTFTDLNINWPTPTRMQSAAVGDLNNDGFLDIMAGFANGFNSPSGTPDRLLMNSGNGNNFIKIKLLGNQSNIDGIGASIDVHTNNLKQLREVRSGESYGIMNSLITHFGLGDVQVVDSVVVRWSSGAVDVIENPTVNSTIIIEEGNTSCVGYLFPADQHQMCDGDSVLINGVWEFEAGAYVSHLQTINGCDSTVMTNVSIIEIDNTVTHNSTDQTLTAFTFGAEYQWIDCSTGLDVPGETNQTFNYTTGGLYAVEITLNGCTTLSECIEVFVVGIDDTELEDIITLIQNPANSSLAINFNRLIEQGIIQILDIKGALVNSKNINHSNSIELPMNNLGSGLYFIRVMIENQTTVLRIVKL